MSELNEKPTTLHTLLDWCTKMKGIGQFSHSPSHTWPPGGLCGLVGESSSSPPLEVPLSPTCEPGPAASLSSLQFHPLPWQPPRQPIMPEPRWKLRVTVVSTEHLQFAFYTQPLCPGLLHLRPRCRGEERIPASAPISRSACPRHPKP